MKKILALVLWIVVFEAVSFSIGQLTQGDVDGWYKSLTAPPLVPPNIIFPIMWTLLYALIASAGWNLWRARGRSTRDGRLLALFAVYMALNWSWSFVFFSLHLLGPALAWIIAIDLLSLGIVILGWRRNRAASLLMIPPTLWTLFATYLNAGYWWLN